MLTTALLLSSALLAAPAAASPAPAPVPAANVVTWEIDPVHSEVGFRVRHLVSRVRGRFTDFGGTLVADPANLAGAQVQVEIRTASIDTDNERRDGHLRSGDFFDAEAHPTITFRSTRVETQGSQVRVHGDLTLRGVTKPVVLEGEMVDVRGVPGKRRIGFEASTRINRMDYGVAWNRAAEGGGVVLGDEVEVQLLVSAVEKTAE